MMLLINHHFFVWTNTVDGATIYTDEVSVYRGIKDRTHESINHSTGDYVRDEVIHTNGIESFWSKLKHGYVGTYYKIFPKHMERNVAAFAGRHNVRGADTID